MKDKKLEAIEKILVETDPVKLIRIGAPSDEYSSEALLIYERVNRYNHRDIIHEVVYNVFLSQFGPTKDQAIRIIGLFDSYREIADRIKRVIGE